VTNIPKSKYKCLNIRCKQYFEREKPGPIVCPKCEHLYVKWLNHEEVLSAIHKREKERKEEK